MRKNCIKELANLFGLEEGEKFQIENGYLLGNYLFMFADGQLQVSENSEDNDTGGTWSVADNYITTGLIYGKLSIRKLPWKPQRGERYYLPAISSSETEMFLEMAWSNTKRDNSFYYMGIICKTKEEAIELTKKMIAAAKEARNNG